MIRVHVYVSGRVQGVFYRSDCAGRARSLGLSGFVRNLPDGRVEAVFEGSRDRVDRMVAWCREGTPASRVQEVELLVESPTGRSGFSVEG